MCVCVREGERKVGATVVKRDRANEVGIRGTAYYTRIGPIIYLSNMNKENVTEEHLFSLVDYP